MSKEYINQAFLKDRFDFEYETGLFRYIDAVSHNTKAGDIAGTITQRGRTSYRTIGINGKVYLAHRLVWIYNYGPIPEGLQIDHINGDGLDNRLENLRLATHTINGRNRRLSKNSPTGINGVNRRKKDGKYISRIVVNGQAKFLGSFSCAEEAGKAVQRAKGLYGFSSSHGANAFDIAEGIS